MCKGDRVRVKGICGTGWTMRHQYEIGRIIAVSIDGKRAAVIFQDGIVMTGDAYGLELLTCED